MYRCANGLPTVSPPKEPVAQVDAGACWSDAGVNYDSHAHNIMDRPGKTPAVCCSLCTDTPGCKFWTHLADTCYLKNATVGRIHLAGATSGGSGTKPPLPPPPAPGHKASPECDQGLRVNGGGQPCLWWSQGCSIGCEKCATDLIGNTGSAGGAGAHPDKIGFSKRFCNASYNSAGAPAPLINSTLPRAAWTMNLHAVEGSEEDVYRFQPWRAPGYAPVVDPVRTSKDIARSARPALP